MRKFFFAIFAVFVLTPGTINAAANAKACWEMMKTACSGKCIVSASSDSDAFSFKCGGTNGCPTGAIIWNQEKRKHYQCGSNGWTVISNETMNKNVENIRNCGDANADPSSTYPAFYNHEKYEFIREHKKNSFLFKSDICKKPKSNAGGVQSSQNSETINSPRSAPATSTTQPQSSGKYITVKGHLLDDEQNPLPSANISVKDSNPFKGVTSDKNGYFTIHNVNENAQLEFKYLGYETITISASEININQPVILEKDAAALDEVMVTECSNINEIYDVDEGKCVPDECKISGGTRDADKKCECKADLGLEPDDAENPQKCQCKENGYEYDPNEEICISTEKNAPEPETIDEEACVNSGGYVQENKCVCVSEKHLTTPDNKTCVCDDDTKYEFNDTAKQCVPKNPFDEEAKKRLQEAKDKLTETDENEQSWANRALTAASTAATGLGTMAAFSAYSEQQADKEAEQDMSNWLATMSCEYGNHQQVKAGNEEISLPDGDLFDYYNEYKQLADRLKTTKTALGLRKGIESEVLYEQAQTGLYQNSNIGKTGGAYTSLARAMTDKEGEDATAWAEQKQDSKTKLWAGVAAAGVGVVGGAVVNYLINEHEWDDDDDDDDDPNLDQTQRRQRRTCRRNGGTWDVTNGCQCSTSAGLTLTTDKTTCTCVQTGYKYNKKTKKCSQSTTTKYNIDVTKDGTDYAGFNEDKTCYQKDKKIELSRNVCSKLLSTPGTWWALFKYARSYSSIFYGESKCEANSSVSKTNCSCKPNRFSLDGYFYDKIDETNWAIAAEYDDPTTCKSNCASKCASSFSTSETLRKNALDPIL